MYLVILRTFFWIVQCYPGMTRACWNIIAGIGNVTTPVCCFNQRIYDQFVQTAAESGAADSSWSLVCHLPTWKDQHQQKIPTLRTVELPLPWKVRSSKGITAADGQCTSWIMCFQILYTMLLWYCFLPSQSRLSKKSCLPQLAGSASQRCQCVARSFFPSTSSWGRMTENKTVGWCLVNDVQFFVIISCFTALVVVSKHVASNSPAASHKYLSFACKWIQKLK